MTMMPTDDMAALEDGAPVDDTSVYFRDLPVAPVGRRRFGPGVLTSVLVLGLVGGLAFLGGVKLQQHRTPAAGAGFAAGAGGRPGGAGAGTVAGVTAGTVKLVDGSSIYVTDQSGNVTKVTTTSSSKVTRADEATVGDVRPGDTVLVQGTPSSNGTVVATQVTDNGPSGTGGGAPGGGGRAFSGRPGG
jgi:hypothetical protein